MLTYQPEAVVNCLTAARVVGSAIAVNVATAVDCTALESSYLVRTGPGF